MIKAVEHWQKNKKSISHSKMSLVQKILLKMTFLCILFWFFEVDHAKL